MIKHLLTLLLVVTQVPEVLAMERSGDRTSVRDAVVRFMKERETGSAATRRARREDFGLFVGFVEGLGIESLDDITPATISAFVASQETRYQPASVKRLFDHAKALLSFCFDHGLVKSNAAKQVRSPHVQKAQPKWFTAEELSEFDKVPIAKDWPTLRAQFCFTVIRWTGLRVGELVKLRADQLDLSSWSITGVTRKGRKHRTFPLPPSIDRLLTAYLKERAVRISARFPGLRGLGAFPLVISLHRSRADDSASLGTCPETVRDWLAQLSPELRPHRLRHTFIRQLYVHTKDLVLCAQAADHADPRLTMRYAAASDDEIRNQVNSMAEATEKKRRSA